MVTADCPEVIAAVSAVHDAWLAVAGRDDDEGGRELLTMYRQLVRSTTGIGPVCAICGQRGFNLGSPAIGNPPTHIGCAQDSAHEAARDREDYGR